MYRCKYCNGFVDAGEIRNGKCDDCRMEEAEREERKDRLMKSMYQGKDGQMILGGCHVYG